MPNPDSTLAAIRQKVRRLTRSPSEAQLTTTDLDNYINTFVVYDFPEQLRTYNLRIPFTFICNPFQDVYDTDLYPTGSGTFATTNPLYNFQNLYLTIHPPVYIAGFQSFYTQSREQFFSIYPLVNSIISIGAVGDGLTTTFSGVISTPTGAPILINNNLVNQQVATLLQNNVLFSSIDTNNNGLSLVDVPVIDTLTGNPTTIGNLFTPSNIPALPPTVVDTNNNVNYVTGAFTITFPAAPATGVAINSQTVPQVVSRPQALLFYDNQFTLRPVPDQPYRINFEVYARPTALLAVNQSPQLEEWWQYISYGSAKKILEDRLDMDSVALILPEFKEQEALCLRRTIVQLTNERVATIYTEQTTYGPNQSGWGWGGGNF